MVNVSMYSMRVEQISAVREVISRYSKEELPHPDIALLTEIGIVASLRSGRILSDVFKGVKPPNLQLVWKEDATPRTIVDVEGDYAIVQTIRGHRPYDDIFIEESGFHKGLGCLHGETGTDITWDADSVDGTRPLAEEKPESTIGVGAREGEEYLLGVIAHPLRNRLIFAMRNLGAYLVALDQDLTVVGSPERIYVSDKTTFAGATIAVDSLYTPANNKRKSLLLTSIRERAFSEGGVISQDETGSNIAYQFDVARGKTLLGITDAIPADKGRWDWSIGRAAIIEARGIMIDPITGLPPTAKSEVVLYGNPGIVQIALPFAQFAYSIYGGIYQGFDASSLDKN